MSQEHNNATFAVSIRGGRKAVSHLPTLSGYARVDSRARVMSFLNETNVSTLAREMALPIVDGLKGAVEKPDPLRSKL